MGRLLAIASAFSLFVSVPSFAQEWVEYASQADFFSVNFPTQPKVESITYTTEYGINLPGHIYSASEGQNHYSDVALSPSPGIPECAPLRTS